MPRYRGLGTRAIARRTAHQNLPHAPILANTKEGNDPLSESERILVVQELARFLPVNDTAPWILKTFGKVVNRTYGHALLATPKWRPLLDRYRSEWALGLVEVPVAAKRYRMEKLQALLDYAEHDENITAYQRERRMLSILEKCRLEMEEAKLPQQTNFFLTNIGTFSDDELLKRRDELVRKIQSYPTTMRRRIVDGLGQRCEEVEATGLPREANAGGDAPLGAASLERPVEGEAPEGRLARENEGVVDAECLPEATTIDGDGLSEASSRQEDPHGDVGTAAP